MFGAITCIACDPGIDLSVFDSDFLQVRIATPSHLSVGPISFVVDHKTLIVSRGGKATESQRCDVRFPGEITPSREMGVLMISIGFPSATKARLKLRDSWNITSQKQAPANDCTWDQ
jgi:hypothetical protein